MTAGVLLTAFGTPDGVDDVPRFLASMGRPSSGPAADALKARYAAVGGRTPFLDITARQAAALAQQLGPDFRVEVGFRHCAPSIAEAAQALVDGGVERGVVLPLAAQASGKSVGSYHAAAREALAKMPAAPPFGFVSGFADHPLLLEAWAERVREGIAALPAEARDASTVLFTAHSLPLAVLREGDPYEREVRATCEGVARRAGLRDWVQCWQSAAGKEWLGPDIGVALEDLAKRGLRGVAVAPVGFVSDHLETLYDLDLDARRRAEGLGLGWHRCPSLNDDPRFVAALADVARRHLPG